MKRVSDQSSQTIEYSKSIYFIDLNDFFTIKGLSPLIKDGLLNQKELFFTTSLVKNAQLWQKQAHLDRLHKCLNYLRIKAPSFEKDIDQLCHKISLYEGKVARLGLKSFREKNDIYGLYWSLKVRPCPARDLRPLSLSLYRSKSWRKGIPSFYKFSNENSMAKWLADNPNFDDVLILSKESNIIESSISAIVFEVDGEYIFPKSLEALKSIGALYFKQELDRNKIPWKEGPLHVEDLKFMHRAWLLNSVRAPRAVGQIGEFIFQV